MVEESSQIMHVKYSMPEFKKKRQIRLATVMVQSLQQFWLRAIRNQKDELDFVQYWYLYCVNTFLTVLR